MSLLQWNMRSFHRQRDDLRLLLSTHQPLVVCLQETLLTSVPAPVPLYHFLSSPFSLAASAILVHHSVPFQSLSLPTTLPCTISRIFLRRWFTVVSLYLSPAVPIDFPQLDSLISRLPRPFLLLGDFNCRHSLWGDSVTSTRGRLLEHFLASRDLVLLNDGSPTHIDPRTHSSSCLDLSFCSPDASLDFSWSVLDSTFSSDHFPLSLSLSSYSRPSVPPRWNFDRADWSSFTSSTVPSRSASDFSSPLALFAFFVSLVLSAASTSIPRSSRPPGSKRVPWWSAECARALRIKRSRWKTYCRRRHTPDAPYYYVLYKQANAFLRRTVKDAKRSSWQSYLSAVRADTPISAVWSKIRKISGKFVRSPAPVLHVQGALVADPLSVANTLGSHFSTVSSGSHLSPDFLRRKAVEESTPIVFRLSACGPLNAPFSSRELLSALGSCKDTCEGPDTVHYRMLKHLSQPALSLLLTLFNALWSAGLFPSEWSVAIILPFLKPLRSGHLPPDYRPIALTSCICKLFERMVNRRLVWFLDSRSLLSSLQFGYRLALSTLDPLIRLESFIRTSFASRLHVGAVFFDIEKAYDTSWRFHILRSLHALGIDGNMGVFLQNFLSNRTFRVRVNDSLSDVFPQVEGVPQGCVLSTTLFLVAINGIVSSLPPRVRSSLYVDDFAIYAAGSTASSLRSLLQPAIDAASAWATDHGFRFSTAKTQAITFSRSHSPPHPPLFLAGSPLQYRDTVRFLGLTFDSRLSWRPHVVGLRTACLQRLNLLRTLSHLSWGADRSSLLYLYRTLVLSKLDYGCQVYASASSHVLRLLDPVHHLGLRLALGAFRSSPVASLYVESGLPSLAHRRDLLSLHYYARLSRTPSSPALVVSPAVSDTVASSPRYAPPFSSRARAVLSRLSLPPVRVLPLRPPAFPPWLFPRPSVCSFRSPDPKSCASGAALRSRFLAHLPSHSGAVHVYTDGSKSTSGTGFAVLFPSSSIRRALPPHASVLTAELSAILLAVRLFLHRPSSSFVVFSDSLNALHLLSSCATSHPLVLQVLEMLFRLSLRRKSVVFCWVPAHVGVCGNESVDLLARSAASSLPASLTPLPASDYLPLFRSALRDDWQRSWTSVSSSFLRSIKPSVSPWHNPSHRCRRWETALARLRIGHTRLTHGFLMSGDPPPQCPSCRSRLTVPHILLSCPRFAHLRSTFFPHLTSLPRPPAPADVLSESPVFSLPRLMHFLDSISALSEL